MTTYQRAPTVLWRRSLGSVVCLRPPDEPVVVATPGAVLWDLLAEPVHRDALVAALATRFAADRDVVDADVGAVLDDLVVRGLVEVAP